MATYNKTVSLVYSVLAVQILLLLAGDELTSIWGVASIAVAAVAITALLSAISALIPPSGTAVAEKTSKTLVSASSLVSAVVLVLLLWGLRANKMTWATMPVWEFGVILLVFTASASTEV